MILRVGGWNDAPNESQFSTLHQKLPTLCARFSCQVNRMESKFSTIQHIGELELFNVVVQVEVPEKHPTKPKQKHQEQIFRMKINKQRCSQFATFKHSSIYLWPMKTQLHAHPPTLHSQPPIYRIIHLKDQHTPEKFWKNIFSLKNLLLCCYEKVEKSDEIVSEKVFFSFLPLRSH